ncbi:MAG TPA: anti-sigma factor [Candidatus Angelobacter sp.]|nr:anti-sigma factor [Candidatus Angelobacter sp.]
MKSCEWRNKIGMYVDGELEPAAEQAFAGHLQSCVECPAAVLEQQELKKAVRIAGKKFSAPPELHAAVFRQVRRREGVSPWWRWGLAPVTLVLLAALTVALWPQKKDDPTIAGLVDQHVNTLASVHPVDVISEDRHTVKPWFQGRLSFTFNLPEVANSPYTLVGGKMAYIQQNPGAELLYQVGQHKITVYIFKTDGVEHKASGRPVTFNVKSWREGNLQFYMVTDASDYEASRLVTMFQDANRS